MLYPIHDDLWIMAFFYGMIAAEIITIILAAWLRINSSDRWANWSVVPFPSGLLATSLLLVIEYIKSSYCETSELIIHIAYFAYERIMISILIMIFANCLIECDAYRTESTAEIKQKDS